MIWEQMTLFPQNRSNTSQLISKLAGAYPPGRAPPSFLPGKLEGCFRGLQPNILWIMFLAIPATLLNFKGSYVRAYVFSFPSPSEFCLV